MPNRSLLLTAVLTLLAAGLAFSAGTSHADGPVLRFTARASLLDFLTPEAWNIDACAYPGGVGRFVGRIYNATEGATGHNVALWVTGFDGLASVVVPSLIPETTYGTRFDVAVNVAVPADAASGVFTGTVLAAGVDTNVFGLPLTLQVLGPGEQCSRGQLVLDGVNDWAGAATQGETDVGADPSASFTVEARVNFADVWDHWTGALADKTDAYHLLAYNRWLLGMYMRCLEFAVWTRSGPYSGWSAAASCTVDPLEGWHHIAGVVDRSNGTLSLYRDGVRVADTAPVPAGHVFSSQAILRVGMGLSGVIDDLRISDAARYSGPSYDVPARGLSCDEHTRALWRFDERDGSTTFDDACGFNDRLVGHNGAHAGAARLKRAWLPVVAR